MNQDITPTPPLKKLKLEQKAETKNPFLFAKSVYSNTLADFMDYPTVKSFSVSSRPTYFAMQQKLSESKEIILDFNERMDELKEEYETTHDDYILYQILQLALSAPNQPLDLFKKYLTVRHGDLSHFTSDDAEELAKNNGLFKSYAKRKHWEYIINHVVNDYVTLQTTAEMKMKIFGSEELRKTSRSLSIVVQNALNSEVLSRKEKVSIVLDVLPMIVQHPSVDMAASFVTWVSQKNRDIFESKEITNWLNIKLEELEQAREKLKIQGQTKTQPYITLNVLLSFILTMLKKY